MKDKTNRNLLGILVILAVLYAASYWLKDGVSGSAELTQDLVDIDTAQISRITIGKPGSRISFERKDGGWLMTTEDGSEVRAVKTRLASMLSSLDGMYPVRVASRDSEKWRDYQVDSTGRRVQIFEGDTKSLDIILGRGNLVGQGTYSTYVRPAEEDNVYVVENFSESSVSADSDNYRNKTILQTTPDSVWQLIFRYYDDQDFTVSKTNGDWQINGTKTDSSRTQEYLSGLRRVSSSAFVDQQQPAADAAPASSLIIQSSGSEDILIELYEEAGSQQILHSSQNPDNYFADTAVLNKLFVKAADFNGL